MRVLRGYVLPLVVLCLLASLSDGYGGVHAVGGAPALTSPPPPYFGFDIARDMESASTGLYVLDVFGGVHAGGGAPTMSRATPYFGYNIAKDWSCSRR